MDKKENPQPEAHKIQVNKWTIKDKYPCPKCSKKLSYPNYICEGCNVQVKPFIHMQFK